MIVIELLNESVPVAVLIVHSVEAYLFKVPFDPLICRPWKLNYSMKKRNMNHKGGKRVM